MVTSQISKSVDFTKTQKSRYLNNKALFLLQLHTKGYFMIKNSFVAEATSNLSVDETESLLKCPCDIYLISALVSEERVIFKRFHFSGCIYESSRKYSFYFDFFGSTVKLAN